MTDKHDHPPGHLAQLQWSDDGQPISSQFDDVYFSKANGLEETRYVFLQHNHLPQRWQQLGDSDRFVIAETGFGTGLNFLAAWQLWQQTAPENAQLQFISVEKHPIAKPELSRALSLWDELSYFSQNLCEQYPDEPCPGFHTLLFDGGRVQLTLIIDDASNGFEQLLASTHPAFSLPQCPVDAWFLDGFAPAKNPDMWQPELFLRMQQLSHSGTSFATFTAAGIVKRGLRECGFAIEKVQGFGHKRDMLRGHLDTPATLPEPETFKESHFNSPNAAPWHYSQRRAPLEDQPTKQKQALVIGAGLAGCQIARNLADKGWQITVIERHSKPGQEASGNPQGILYAKLSHRQETLSDFNLAALQFAQRHYTPLWQQQPQLGEQCGVIQLAQSDKTEQQQQLIAEALSSEHLTRRIDKETASTLAGIDLAQGGLFFPRSGWLIPPLVCEHLLQHPRINAQFDQPVSNLQHRDDQWQLLDGDNQCIASATTAIICCANASQSFSQTRELPLKPVRGQITQIPADPSSRRLKTVLCGEGYIAPAHHDHHCLGASFDLGSLSTATTADDHRQNLQRLREQFPGLTNSAFTADDVDGRAALRCTSPDYLPLTGPAPNSEAFDQDFQLLRKNARSEIPRPGPYHPNLFISTGYGSRGLAYIPLCSMMLAAQINGDPMPMGRELQKALNPARFQIRDLIRKKR
ncbi:MAG: bifunctional tRNA (5-methylaminomethyl-2-thiouridine)(34)-methyltransferase MnmD/FAD-dependent 5-carboxymethylaminomethyl-2-thiouridine(34) oxidoreductase MnmC [Candidatus Pelagadaptatus aseana]|uniref:bifunctional tRNA (5-methylaminomethyl-2-thiouridine)(34)-methyltransferase MnmD/FAD-dependent 5-carboxymethylaminomethyl-2-thiouridine(34) oxidoreductase MnmC n=1 Tax=Candidatus Pelagadaptatus aseana TaxID=3120508 RepID=UPI0039B1FC79